MDIRLATEEDQVGMLAIGRELATDGTTYVFREDISDEDLLTYWYLPAQSYVAVDEDGIQGMYKLLANQPGRGSHVANASYAVAEAARGRGLGRALAEHSLEEARRRGFRSMQFNLVVATNTGALRLWEALGFRTVGLLSEAFEHAELGFVDAHVMVRALGARS